MLLEFSVQNFRSFNERKTLSLEAASISDFPENIIQHTGYKLLSSAVLYGANASGKSNFLRAMGRMKRIVISTASQSSVSGIPYDPFLLNVATRQSPTAFEIIFLVDTIRYRYGFEYTRQEITSEWLFETKKQTEKPLFARIKDGIQIWSGFQEGKNLEGKTRDNALFLSVVDQFNGEVASKIIQWFARFQTLQGLSHNSFRKETSEMLEDIFYKKMLIEYYNKIDLGFYDIVPKKEEIVEIETLLANQKFPAPLVKESKLYTSHKIFDEENQEVGNQEFDLSEKESSGTNKIIDISGPLFKTLLEGGVLVIDELDAKLHPLLTLSVISLFKNPQLNIGKAQLIFAVHDTNLLSIGRLRRDQIYFVEKDRYEVSDLYSLVEYDLGGLKVRKDASFEKDYINGKYGAIPFLGGFENILSAWQEK